MEDLMELQRQDLFGLVAHHLGERGVGKQDGAVMFDGQHGNRDPLEHNKCRQLFQGRHRRIFMLPITSSLHRPIMAHNIGYTRGLRPDECTGRGDPSSFPVDRGGRWVALGML
jgi:hypothetical protein